MSKKNDIHADLDTLLEKSEAIKELQLRKESAYVLFSDLHLGNGKICDNFVHNESTLNLALAYYLESGFSIILAGDIEDLWQFSLKSTQNRYGNSIYKNLNKFGPDRLIRIYGNHDIRWRKNSQNDPLDVMDGTSFRGVKFDDWLVITHGHEGRGFTKLWVLIKTLGVVLFRLFEPVALKLGYENRSAPQSQIPKSREKAFYDWAKQNKKVIICGHTHRAIFASRHYVNWLEEQIRALGEELQQNSLDEDVREKLLQQLGDYETELRSEIKRGRDYDRFEENGVDVKPCYFNIGSGLYRRGITCLEIAHGHIRLIKWSNDEELPEKERRQFLWEEFCLSRLRDRVVNSFLS